MSEVRCGLPGRVEVQIDGTLAMLGRRLALQSLLPLTVRAGQAPFTRGPQRHEAKTQFGAQN